MSARLNLRRLMWVGYNGGSTLKGADPQRVISALQQRFDVVPTLRQGAMNFELRCYDQEGRQRLAIRYGWAGNGWRYEPVAIRQRRPRRQAGDVVYQPDGSYTVAA